MDVNIDTWPVEYLTNDSNGTGPPAVADWSSRVSTVIHFGLIGGLGIITNSLPVTVAALGYVEKNAVNVTVINLAFCELLLCLSFVFGQSFFVLWREWIPVAWCHLLSIVHFVAAFASFIFPPLLAANRYVALFHPNVYETWYSKPRVVMLVIGAWSVSVAVPLVFLLAGKTGFDEDNDHCCMLVKSTTWTIVYWVLIIFPLLCFCDGVVICANYKIYLRLKKYAEEVVAVHNVVNEHKEVMYFLLVDMMCPICFQTVYHVFKFILVHRTSEFLKRFFILLYLFNSILRGLITILMLRPYRRAVRRLFCGQRESNAVRPIRSLHRLITRPPNDDHCGCANVG